MHILKSLIEKARAGECIRAAGLMSGTSADGVDAAIVDIEQTAVRLVAFNTYPYPADLRKEVLSLCHNEKTDAEGVCHCNFVMGHVFADAVLQLCRDSSISPDSLDLIGSHGQTIYHNPSGKRYADTQVASTLQIGEPSVIAEHTKATVIADFRCRDVAAGGEGAPLVPYTDYFLFHHGTLSRAIQNIGGIANVTFLPAGCTEDDVVAFDTGPGNMVIDALIESTTNGRSTYDRNGALAARGNVHAGILEEMLRHPFIAKQPPKSTGREHFGKAFVDGIRRTAQVNNVSPADLVATATAFTAAAIAMSYRKFLPALPNELLLCGGGAHNKTLVHMLNEQLEGVRITTTDEFGISSDAKEAVSFAILALATLKGLTGNVPAATGADRKVVLGKIVPA